MTTWKFHVANFLSEPTLSAIPLFKVEIFLAVS